MTQTPQPRRTRGRVLKWAFGMSLALNLVFVGIFAGAALRHAGGKRGWHPKSEAGHSSGVSFVRSLSQEDRRALRDDLKDGERDLPSRAERRALHQELIAVLRAEQFDAAKLEQLLAAQTAAAEQFSGEVQAAWLRRVSTLSLLERQEVAERLDEMLKRPKRKGPKRP